MNSKFYSARDFALGQLEAIFVQYESVFLYPLQLKAFVNCPLDFRKYPFDTQICPFVLNPVEYFAIDFVWRSPPRLKRSSEKNGKKHEDDWQRSVFYEDRIEGWNDNNTQGQESDVHYAKVEYRFKRSPTAFVVQSMVPTLLLVIASYGSLYIPPSQIPGRMTLAITTCLTQIAMITSAIDGAPATSYLKVNCTKYNL